jgi:hypothetical protein
VKKMVQMRSSRWRRRGLGAVTALTITGGTLALTAGSAAAWSLPQKCSGAAEANVCLDGYTNDPYVQVHVGIDVWMSAQDAEAILAQPGNAFSAALYGVDGTSRQLLQTLPLSAEFAGPSNLSAEFDMSVLRSRLNEDPGGWPRPNFDEVVARVSYYDARWGLTRTFETPHWSIQF